MHPPRMPPNGRKILLSLHWVMLAYAYGFFVLKSALQFSHPADLLAYYLPKALMYAGLTTYEYGEWAIRQAEGYPDLANILQGVMIKLTGQINAINTINIVAFACVIGCIFLIQRKTFSARWFLTFCLALPLFYYHVTIGFTDLFASCMILLAFAGLHNLSAKNHPLAAAMMLVAGCTLAMASKMTVWPAACTIAIFGIYVLFQSTGTRSLSILQRSVFGILLIAGIGFYPLKNYVRFDNPTHPLQLHAYMKTLPAVAVVSEVEEMNIPLSLQTKSQSMQFVYSLLEINRGDSVIPYEWSSFQNHGRTFERDQLGGFSFLTVIVLATILLLAYFTRPIHKLSFLVFSTLVIMTANLPHSGVLRYFLYIPLIGIFIICSDFRSLRLQIQRLAIAGFILCIFFVIPNLGKNYWTIDLRNHDEFAPTAARKFWEENANQVSEATLLVEGAYPSTIYWSGPDFNTWKVKEILDNRYINTIRPAQQ